MHDGTEVAFVRTTYASVAINPQQIIQCSKMAFSQEGLELVNQRRGGTADCSEFAKGAKRTKKIEKSKKSENAEAGWESAFRCLCVLEPQQSAINRHIRAQ